MKFGGCTIIVPIIRETDIFEQMVQNILDTCDASDLYEFIIVIHKDYTEKASYASIKKMKEQAEKAGVSYWVLTQRLPGMGGALRDALNEARGTHVIMQSADIESTTVHKMIEYAKKMPADIISVSRHMKGSRIEGDYEGLKLAWNILSQKYCSILYHSNLTDYTFAYRICPAEYYRAVQWEELRHPFALETTLKFLRLGIMAHEIPGHQSGGSQSGYGDIMKYFLVSLKVRFMPKRKILKPGVVLSMSDSGVEIMYE